MILKEIELDLPYQKNLQYIKDVQATENIEYAEATKRDYENNWKRCRREFQLKTKCMTSMIERIMIPIQTKECWKILIECVNECTEEAYKSFLGVYIVQIKIDKEDFFDSMSLEQKKKVIDIVLQGISKLEKVVDFDVKAITNACEEVVKRRYYNEWYWSKPIYYGDKCAIIKIIHDTNNVQICMQIIENTVVIKDEVLITALPDERMYSSHLGAIKWISKNEVALIGKEGSVYKCICD